jgi:hypothetical protein
MRRADIVATRGPVLWVIEVKQSLGFRVLDQALEWRERSSATWVSVAVPTVRVRSDFLEEACRRIGIGLLAVTEPCLQHARVRERIAPVTFRPRQSRGTCFVRGYWKHDREWANLDIVEEYDAAAGNAESDYWSPYRQTCRNLFTYVKLHPGCLFKEAMDQTSHHYGSASCARSAMSHWLRQGRVPGISMVKEGGRLRLVLKEASCQ